LSKDARAAAVTDIEADEAGTSRRRAVAGYDYTFSVPKSVSVLWGGADAGVQSVIATAHHQAVADVVALMERDVAATRTGVAPSDGAVAQVDVTGLIATVYDHYDSRAGDPQLHTHVVVSNKVKTVYDNRWRSLDGRPMHAAVHALSAHYNAVLADHPSTLTSQDHLAIVLRGLGRLEEAETEHRAVLEARRRVLGADHPDTLASRNNLAGVLGALGRQE
jgi:conjugative relaxase-like TrwC/TraI family protein